MWKNINAEEKSRAAFFPEDQCQVIIKNNKHTSFFTREKWTLYSPKWSMETGLCTWLKVPGK